MVRGRRLALQLAGRGSLLSAGARPSCRRGLGFYVSNGEILCSAAKHLVARDIGITTRPIAPEATHEIHQKRSFTRIPKLLSKFGNGQVVGTFDILEGRQLLELQRRGMSSSEPSTTASDEHKAAPVSRSDDNVSGQWQPPLSQPLEGNLMPTSEEEEKIAPVLARSDLLITRNVEWANIALGFEQQNKYVVLDPHQPQAPVGYVVEESNVLLRQVLRTHRPFVVSILDANGEEVCRVRRPAFLINSSMLVEINGKVVGECHRRWHLWKRIYDVYIEYPQLPGIEWRPCLIDTLLDVASRRPHLLNRQFATVENPGFWNWTFTLTDDSGGALAEINRNWRGFGFEFLTDTGQYVVRFGDVLPNGSIHHATPILEEAVDRKPFLLSKSENTGGAEMQQLQEAADQVDSLAVSRPLSLTERAVVLALAVSLDNDYFSRHSTSGVGMPLPIPFYTSEAVSAEDSPAGSSNAESETGHEVFPRQGFQGSQSENPAGDEGVSSDKMDDTNDPYFGMFDEPGGGDQNNDDQFFDDTPDSGDSWGLSDWGLGGDDN